MKIIYDLSPKCSQDELLSDYHAILYYFQFLTYSLFAFGILCILWKLLKILLVYICNTTFGQFMFINIFQCKTKAILVLQDRFEKVQLHLGMFQATAINLVLPQKIIITAMRFTNIIPGLLSRVHLQYDKPLSLYDDSLRFDLPAFAFISSKNKSKLKHFSNGSKGILYLLTSGNVIRVSNSDDIILNRLNYKGGEFYPFLKHSSRNTHLDENDAA